MGFAASWLTEWIAYDDAVRDALGLGPNERFASPSMWGAARLPKTSRPALSDVVTVTGMRMFYNTRDGSRRSYDPFKAIVRVIGWIPQ